MRSSAEFFSSGLAHTKGRHLIEKKFVRATNPALPVLAQSLPTLSIGPVCMARDVWLPVVAPERAHRGPGEVRAGGSSGFWRSKRPRTPCPSPTLSIATKSISHHTYKGLEAPPMTMHSATPSPTVCRQWLAKRLQGRCVSAPEVIIPLPSRRGRSQSFQCEGAGACCLCHRRSIPMVEFRSCASSEILHGPSHLVSLVSCLTANACV
jgi:hypothetical protein